MLAQGRAKKNQRTSGRCQDELTEIVEGRPRFSFFLGGGLNLEQVLAYRKCGEGIALLFFLRSEPGTGARPRLQKMWHFFFCGLNLEQVLTELTENVERDRDC